jgi:hypothetical protein
MTRDPRNVCMIGECPSCGSKNCKETSAQGCLVALWGFVGLPLMCLGFMKVSRDVFGPIWADTALTIVFYIGGLTGVISIILRGQEYRCPDCGLSFRLPP